MAAHNALSWDEIVERGKKHNKTVICEVEKRYGHRYFKLKCDICGEEQFLGLQVFDNCMKCSRINKSLTVEDVISRSIKVHGSKYNYDLVEYVNSSTKIKIFCNNCNIIFEQPPSEHMRGAGCLKCSIKNKKLLEKDLIERFKKIHGDKYNYDLVEYVNSSTKIKIFCNSCNIIFEQPPNEHMKGSGCFSCKVEKSKLTYKDVVLRSVKVHGSKYDYSFVEYVNSFTKIKILCKSCNNIFEQKPSHHLRGVGCPRCNESKGEIKVARYLSNKNIKFIPQKTFQSLRDIRPLKCDFYLEDLNLLIEYDGAFHYIAKRGSTPENKQKNLEAQQRRDKIKNEWARKNNIPLLRIPYWDYDRIEELIDAFIFEHTRKKEVKQLVLEGI